MSKKTVVVTGAANGIGAATASAFAKQGHLVWITDRDENLGQSFAKSLSDDGADVEFKQLDVTNEEHWDALRAAIEEKGNRVDVLVNCAGRNDFGFIADTPWKKVAQVMDVNLGGAYLGIQKLLPLLSKRGSDEPKASVVNISSMAAGGGVPFFSAYAASKAALTSMTKTAALEFARLQVPVRVNAIEPGTINTEMFAETQEMLSAFGKTKEELTQYSIDKHPVGRLGTVEDVVYAVLYLADDRASFTTGLCLPVSGGRGAGEW
ncbi:SDR family oxidoreductase [Spongiibacter sp. KMU-166]|uniref:SDR family oxidoreductase n=1 Tax=Spongiibacter thalassae TaxID=2721624 RepID=A0ABX1GHN7_9GAMM|nr:SDR family oxidoreductase [Spongiibacter thalassae]NKI18688.1 SDR family oxidoreductase [Spongiibacter thalassae]